MSRKPILYDASVRDSARDIYGIVTTTSTESFLIPRAGHYTKPTAVVKLGPSGERQWFNAWEMIERDFTNIGLCTTEGGLSRKDRIDSNS